MRVLNVLIVVLTFLIVGCSTADQTHRFRQEGVCNYLKVDVYLDHVTSSQAPTGPDVSGQFEIPLNLRGKSRDAYSEDQVSYFEWCIDILNALTEMYKVQKDEE